MVCILMLSVFKVVLVIPSQYLEITDIAAAYIDKFPEGSFNIATGRRQNGDQLLEYNLVG